MMQKHSARAGSVLAAALMIGLAGSALTQGWRTPTGNAQAVVVSAGGSRNAYATASLPTGGGMGQADQDAVSTSMVSANAATAVTSGSQSVDRFGVQSVATAANVAILGGRVQADRVIAIATLSDATVDGDGSSASGLVVDGVPYSSDTFAPNTRVELPGAGYMLLNEQLKAKGRGVGLTVNMIHVYLLDAQTGNPSGEIIVASAMSGNGS